MSKKSVLLHRIPKYERLQRMAERYPSLDPDALEAHIALKVVGEEVAAAARQDFVRYGLGEGRFVVLVLLLEQQPRSLSHSELAELSGVTKGNITGLVDGLERDGFVKREDSGADRRVRPISLTPVGQHHIEKIMPDHFSRVASVMGGLSVSERKTLAALLLKVQAGLSALKPE